MSGSGVTIDGASYTVDSAGNRTAKTDQLANVTTNYSYDSIYELLSATQGGTTTESYSYDPVGNRLSSLGVSSYTNNSSNELTATSNASFTYDNNGNMTSKTVSAGTTNFAWDFENRMASVTLPSSGGTVSFKYDPFGRRIEKISPNATSIFVYDGNNLIETVNSSGSTVARYTQGQNIDEPLAVERGTTTDYYNQDGLGSITSLTASNGSITQSYSYDSFGNTTNSSGSLTNFFRYAAREFDTETNLYYYRARYYDPNSGRFLNEDPVRLEGGVNFYRYVQNNPVDFFDPTGLCKCLNADPWQQIQINILGVIAKVTGKTIGIGLGASGGAGRLLGVSGGVSGQLMVSPNGQAGLGYAFGSNSFPMSPTPVGITIGAGILKGGWGLLGGVQISISNAQTPQQLSGDSVDVNGGGADGFGAGGDVSFGKGGIWQGTVTIGGGLGGWGGAGIYQHTVVVPFCDN